MELMDACASSKKCVSLMPRRWRVAQCTISVRVRPGETVLTRSLVIGMRCGQNFDYNVTLSAVDYTLPGAEVVGETTSSRFESSVCSRKGSATFARAARQST